MMDIHTYTGGQHLAQIPHHSLNNNSAIAGFQQSQQHHINHYHNQQAVSAQSNMHHHQHHGLMSPASHHHHMSPVGNAGQLHRGAGTLAPMSMSRTGSCKLFMSNHLPEVVTLLFGCYWWF